MAKRAQATARFRPAPRRYDDVRDAVRAAVEAAGGSGLEQVLASADAERGVEKLPPDWLAGAAG